MGELVHETFRSFVARQLGGEGRAWLDALPSLVAAVAGEWELELGPELPGGVLAFVCAAGDDQVLKVAGPWDRPADENAALRRWAGGPSPRLLRADPGRGVLLLERIRPGGRAARAAPKEVAALLARLHVPPWPSLRPLGGEARRRVERAVEQGRASAERADRALHALAELEHDTPPPVLLHGDLDERNLLRCDTRGLAAIDPLPCAGDPAYDAAHWAHANGRPGVAERRAAIAAAADLDPERVRRWGEVVAAHG
jgi:streptomycin 6-kinase